ncbi:hypothetical protein [Streptomyces sp. C10-9-1]|uniref:hypothetical protein n=1 Tax=Streptomyces sp. C10-9-1 TaxID=1859285 RepID=UPI003D732786
MPQLTFTLAGRDELSRVLNGTADSADRLRLRMAGITADADGNLRNLQGRFLSVADAQRTLDDRSTIVRNAFANLADASDRLGDSLRANLISLAPAAIPAAAGLAGSAAAVATQFGAVALAAGAYALALGPQIGAIGEAVEAQDAYEDAVRTSGRTSREAVQAQVALQQQLEKMSPATREAAAAVGLLRDSYQDWSDSLSADVMGPFTKGVAVTNALLPTTTGLVKGASTQFDRLITLVGGSISTPGFDRLNTRVTEFSERTMRRGVDALTRFLARAEAGELDDSGLSRFFAYARENGPAVWDTLENVGDALLNVLEAGSDIGVGMLDVINALSGIVSAVPPEAIATLLQLAIAIKAVKLATAAGAAASAGAAAFAVQIAAMRSAAAAAPGPLAATTAAIATLSRTAKLAIAGTGIGLLLIALAELSQAGKTTPPDVDRLTTSLGELGRTGKATGYVAAEFGADFEKLRDQINAVIDPSVAESINNWGAKVTGGMLDAGVATEEFGESVGAIDDGLANLVSSGKADVAAAAVKAMTDSMRPEQVAKFTSELGDYREALAAQAFEQDMAAQSMGLFGQQAQDVQAKLDAQRLSADGLSESINALSNAALVARGGIRGMEAAIDAATKAFQDNGATLDENTEKGRANNAALDQLASATIKAAEGARANGASWSETNKIYDRGRTKLIESAQQMGLTEKQAKSLADQILRTPDKTARLRGNMEDLQQKLDRARARLKSVPDSRKAKIRAEISQLEAAIREARIRMTTIDGKTAHTYIYTHHIVSGSTGEARRRDRPTAGHYATGGPIGRYATGGPIPGFPGGGLLTGPGTPTSDSILLWGSTGEYMVRAAAVAKYGLKFMDALNEGRLPAGRPAARPGMPAAAPVASTPTVSDRPQVTYNVYPRQSVISVEDLRLLQRQEEAQQRVGRPR